MLERGLRCPATTSLGRWFDAAAALLGVRATSAFEGQAPMQLEALAAAARAPADAALSDLVMLGADGVLDPTPLLARLADLPATPAATAEGAALFHHALADGLARWVTRAADATGLRHVALGGGCVLNGLLTTLLVPRLEAAGLAVLEARQAPPNDGGLALGQAWVAIARITAGG
jgi:hydrogenase maturation protein HypF